MIRLNRRSSMGSTSSLRRSSVSAKDIQAIQLALQKQQRISTQLIAVLLATIPIFTYFYLYCIHLHHGALLKSLLSFLSYPFLLQIIPPFWDLVAWKITVVLLSIQFILYSLIPHDQILVMSSSGDYYRQVNSFACFLLSVLLYLLGCGLGLYRGEILFLHFNSVILCFTIICFIIMFTLIIAYRLGTDYNITTLAEFYFGVELHPRVLDMDLKHFLRSRVTFVIWPLFIISAIQYQMFVQGEVTKAMMGLSTVQMFYIIKFHWNEDLVLNGLDERRAHCGFYRLWSDLVLYPVLYTSPVLMVVYSQKKLAILACGLFTLLGLVSIYMTSVIDRQRYEFRKEKGNLKIHGVDAFFISAKYRNDNGDTGVSLLLGSGYWSHCRHPNYLTESLTFLYFVLFQGYAPVISYTPFLFVTGYLLVRLLNDENRCLAKYGQYWIQYCTKVQYRLLPGVF